MDKMQKLNKKMLKAWVQHKEKKAKKTWWKIILLTLKEKNT